MRYLKFSHDGDFKFYIFTKARYISDLPPWEVMTRIFKLFLTREIQNCPTFKFQCLFGNRKWDILTKCEHSDDLQDVAKKMTETLFNLNLKVYKNEYDSTGESLHDNKLIKECFKKLLEESVLYVHIKKEDEDTSIEPLIEQRSTMVARFLFQNLDIGEQAAIGMTWKATCSSILSKFREKYVKQKFETHVPNLGFRKENDEY